MIGESCGVCAMFGGRRGIVRGARTVFAPHSSSALLRGSKAGAHPIWCVGVWCLRVVWASLEWGCGRKVGLIAWCTLYDECDLRIMKIHEAPFRSGR